MLSLSVTDESLPENDESYPMRLSTEQTDVTITNGVRQLTILKNDAPVHFSQVCGHGA